MLRRICFEPLESRKLLTGWTNFENPTDINADLRVSALDVMIITEALIDKANSGDNDGFPPFRDEHGPFVDVNADGFFSPIDALIVVNHILSNTPVAFAQLTNDTQFGGGVNSDRKTADPSMKIRIDNRKPLDQILIGWDINSNSDLHDVSSRLVGNTLNVGTDLIQELRGAPLADGDHYLTVYIERGGQNIGFPFHYRFTVDSSQI